MTAPKRTKAHRDTKKPRRIGADGRAQAYELLVTGLSAREVARELGVQPRTVRNWRDSDEGHARMAELRRARAASFDETQRDLTAHGLQLARKALNRMGDLLDSPSGHVVRAAATDTLDRFGPSRREHVHNTGDDDEDFDPSLLSDEKLARVDELEAELEAIYAEARQKRGADDGKPG